MLGQRQMACCDTQGYYWTERLYEECDNFVALKGFRESWAVFIFLRSRLAYPLLRARMRSVRKLSAREKYGVRIYLQVVSLASKC